VAERRRPGRSDGSAAPGDARLGEYRDMRDFDRTAEPPGSGGTAHEAAASDGERRFVVQRHRARRLHYDMRLEVDGALASWAVPKGPTLDPRVRSLAVHVEDHPLEYAEFEGVIPSGEYGGGDVIVWDRGTWSPAGTDDPAAAIAAGELHFDVASEKLAGRFVLVRTDRERSRREQWLLLHKNDEHARPGWTPEDHPRSVKTGRTNDEVAAAPDAMWRSDLPAHRAEVAMASTPPRWDPPTDDELAALDELGAAGRWELQGRELSLTDLDDVLPVPAGAGHGPLTRRQLVRYYATVSPTLLPYLAERPVDLQAPCGDPTGEGPDEGPGVADLPADAPDWLDLWRDDSAPGGDRWHTVIDSPAALAWVAHRGLIELRPRASRRAAPDRPTWAVIGIDASADGADDDVGVVARLHRTALGHLGVDAAPKLTSAGGVEIWVPLRPGPTFAAIRAWVASLARAVAATVPEMVGPVDGAPGHHGTVRLDGTRNAAGRPPVAPYSVQAAAGAPVSMPLTWDELDDPEVCARRWTILDVGARLTGTGDPFAPLLDSDQVLPAI
jgi:bifunctional non-homologous end joining protein LigD